MGNNQEQMNTEDKPKKGSSKWKAYIALIALICGALTYGYFWLQKTNAQKAQAEAVIEQALQYETLQSAVMAERTRCENFIAQKEGDFGSFEYCKKFIDWSDGVLLKQ